jgi:hypothetical protein
MCQFRSSPKEIEYFGEDKVIFFLEFFVLNNLFNSYCAQSNIFFYFRGFVCTLLKNLGPTFNFFGLLFSPKILVNVRTLTS